MHLRDKKFKLFPARNSFTDQILTGELSWWIQPGYWDWVSTCLKACNFLHRVEVENSPDLAESLNSISSASQKTEFFLLNWLYIKIWLKYGTFFKLSQHIFSNIELPDVGNCLPSFHILLVLYKVNKNSLVRKDHILDE